MFFFLIYDNENQNCGPAYSKKDKVFIRNEYLVFDSLKGGDDGAKISENFRKTNKMEFLSISIRCYDDHIHRLGDIYSNA